MRVSITVNGDRHEHDVASRTLLVQFLRESCGLTGTKVGCDTTSCGACTVLYEGESVKSCTMLAAQADGGTVTTIEGLADGDTLHPVQAAFRERRALQCGFCTPGFVVLAAWLAGREPGAGPEQVREVLSSNLCRCTGYGPILAATLDSTAGA
jgi:carbon-monoxide dehydrogenase small subunit